MPQQSQTLVLEPEATSGSAEGSIVAAISREVVRVYARVLGRGPTKSRTDLREDHVLCVLEDIFTRAELTLIRGGCGARVVEARSCLHEQMAPELARIVEEQTGRGVRRCVGQVDVETGLALEFFSFER